MMSRICKSFGWLVVLGIWASEPGLFPNALAGSLPPGIQKLRTTRITQLTGGYDPEGKPFLNDTVPWRVAGVDLGANTEHQGRLYFFFGDVVPAGSGSWPPYDSDLVAYTQDSTPEPSGFRLTPVTRNGAFYPFTVHVPGDRPPAYSSCEMILPRAPSVTTIGSTSSSPGTTSPNPAGHSAPASRLQPTQPNRCRLNGWPISHTNSRR